MNLTAATQARDQQREDKRYYYSRSKTTTRRRRQVASSSSWRQQAKIFSSLSSSSSSRRMEDIVIIDTPQDKMARNCCYHHCRTLLTRSRSSVAPVAILVLCVLLQSFTTTLANNNRTTTTLALTTPPTTTTKTQTTTTQMTNNSDTSIVNIKLNANAEALVSLLPTNGNGNSGSSNNNKLYEGCKLQAPTGLHITNLSQIMFQPLDVCSSWHKMMRSSTAAAHPSSNPDDYINYPWYYIEQLNLSHNNLTVLHDSSGLSRLANLLELHITHNQLERCEESSLVGLKQLQTLDLSHNKLPGLPAKLFQPVKQTIKKLNLSFNSISVLVPTLFDSLQALEYLDLSHNIITSHWINDKLFKNLTQLHYLDLSFNSITVINSQMAFSSLQQLETLSLQNNELRQVPETIQYLSYLSSLDLSQNSIHDITNASYLANCRLLFNLNLESNLLENITRDAFSDLPALKVLNLANNRIHHLDQQAFDYVPDLHALRLDSNRLIDFGQAFVNLRFLVMLNISSNRISSFDYAQIPLGLQWLDLHSNKIDKLNNFYYSPTAQQQFSSANDINQQVSSSIGQQWQSMLRLTTLDASFNLIKDLDNTSLPESLETVQLNNNHIRNIASHTFSTKSNLTRINLSHNQLTAMPYDSLKLHGNRDNNNIQAQQQISMISTNGLKFVDIYLANNPLVCDCNTGWLSQLLLASSTLLQGNNYSNGGNQLLREHQLILSRQLPRVADAHLINCYLQFVRQSPNSIHDPHQWSPVMAANQLTLRHAHHPHTANNRDLPLIIKQSELLASVHLCPYKSHCFALCYCCDFDACDCEMSCPENCSCYYDQTWSTNIVDCSANNQINGANSQHGGVNTYGNSRLPQSHIHHRPSSSQLPNAAAPVKFVNIPDKIPMDVTELYLDGLELLHLRGNALIGRRNLKTLYLNNSQVYSIEPKAFATQKALRILQLNSNYLSELHGHEFEQQVELRELYLANNQLTSIANMTFASLRSLQILHLQNNQLYHLNFWSNLPDGHKLISMNLGSNPWSCQCDHVEPMLQWLHQNSKHVHDRKSVSCQYNRTNSLHLLAPLLGSLSASTSAVELEDASAVYGPTYENYPMFDVRMCLNYTVYPSIIQSPILPSPPAGVLGQVRPKDYPAPNSMIPSFDESTTVNNNLTLQNPPNDEPENSDSLMRDIKPNIPSGFPYDDGTSSTGLPSKPPMSAGHGTWQFPPNSKANMFSSTFLLGATSMILILIVVILSLIHYRRPMSNWFYSRYGLNMFPATKSHNHGIGSLGKSHLHHHHHHHHHPHLHCGASSAGSTSSSSAASSNLSQALCQQQSSTVAASSGLVTTPLIVTNTHQLFNSSATTTTTTSPYNDDEKLFDAYITYSKLDEQFINDFIAPELENGQPPYRVALHYRDVPATAAKFLPDCIIETANASRRIIMILSEQLLRTEWTQFEFRTAHLEALRINYRHRLIVIMFGQPSLANLDADIAQWLRSCTCIQWGDKMFWQRLRFAMPELPYNRQQQHQPAAQQHCLRYQTLAPHQAAGKQQQQQKHNLGANLLKSAGGLLGGGGGSNSNNSHHMHQLPPSYQQQLVTSRSTHQSLGRPLPPISSANLIRASAASSADEHHYAHLTPSTMIQQQHTYHQPIYGDPQQQQQQQQQQMQSVCTGRDNPTVPVHI